MNIPRQLLLLATWISLLTGCSSMIGNVIPNQGPSMEQAYDQMGNQPSSVPATSTGNNRLGLRSPIPQASPAVAYFPPVTNTGSLSGFKRLPNPELQLYIYPHLAGTDQVPVPGYYTAFDAYEHNYYALPSESTRSAS